MTIDLTGGHHVVVTYADASDVARHIERGRDRVAARLGAAEAQMRRQPMGPLEQLDEVGALLGGVVGNITPDQLDNATPCEKYAVRDVLGHMIGGATAFAAAFRGQEAPEAPQGDELANFGPVLGNLVAAINEDGALQRTVEAPFGAVPGDTFARFVALDGLMHGWDMATATGQTYEPSDALVAEVAAFTAGAIEPLRDGDTFATPTEVPATASPIEKLAALTGRRVPQRIDQ